MTGATLNPVPLTLNPVVWRFSMADQDNERSVVLSVLAGIGVGVLVGAIAGLLLAPRSGSETRQSIGGTLTDLGNKITDLSQQVASKVKSAVEQGKQAMAEHAEQSEG